MAQEITGLRTLPGQDKLVETLRDYIPTAEIYETDTTTTMKEQIEKVRGARVLLLDYGSSLLVNGFFSENTYIYVLGDFDHIHCKNPKPYFLLQESLRRNCHYMYIPPYLPANLIISFISNHISLGAPPFPHIYRCWKSCLECSNII